MRYALISDVHGNLAALDAVLDRTTTQNIDHVVCLGDVVGYGARPRACLKRLQDLQATLIAGNHDQAAAGVLDYRTFNGSAYAAMNWTRSGASGLDDEDFAFLRGLPVNTRFGASALACHGMPDSVCEYVVDAMDADLVFDVLDRRYADVGICFFGHTHLPVCWHLDRRASIAGRTLLEPGRPVTLAADNRYLVNPGSVGQPRDRNPLASYLIYDEDRQTIRLERTAYDVGRTQKEIRAAGLPERLAQRLAEGR